MAKRLEYEITTDPSKGIAGLKQFSGAVKKEMKTVDDSVDGSSTNAQKLAKALSGMADEIETEMKKAVKATDALSKALGPEMAARTDVASVVTDLKKMGVGFEEIEADADALAASLRRLDEVQLAGVAGDLDRMEDSTKRAKAGVDDIGKSADSSKSVLANMVGNATQDLGTLGGVAGSAGVAIGQIGEYAADAAAQGEGLASIVGSFGTVAGPIAGIALVTAGVGALAKHFQDSKKRAEEAKQAAKDFADAIKAANGNLEQASRQRLGDVLTDEQFVLLDKYKLTMQDLTNLVNGRAVPAFSELRDKAEQYDEIARSMQATGRQVIPTETFQQLADAKDAYDDINSIVEDNRDALLAGNDAFEARNRVLGKSVEVTDDAAASQERLNQKYEDAAAALQAQIDALNAQISAQAEAAQANQDIAASTDEYHQFLQDLPKAIEDAKDDQEKLNDLYREGVDDAKAIADATVAHNEALAAAAGQTRTATQSIDDWNREMLFSAQEATPAVRDQILGYIADQNAIPKEKVTEIAANVDAATFEDTAAKLATLSGTRTLAVEAEAHTTEAEKDIQKLIQERNMIINAQIVAKGGAGFNLTGGPRFDQGGMVGPRGGIAGERGPEVLNSRWLTTGPVYVPPGTIVLSRAKTQQLIQRRHLPGYDRGTRGAPIPITAGSTRVNNVTVNAAVIGNTFDVMHAVSDAVRRAERLLPRHG